MENKKCSFSEHKEIDAISFCQECNLYLCNKCEKLHLGWFNNHHLFSTNKEIKDIFTGFCKEENHLAELKYFCKTHNILCCGECITKIKDNENGKHTDCDICLIKDIENDKKNKLKNNIKCLEELSINIQKSVDDLKRIFEKLNEEKEKLKLNIQKIFTKIRNALNNREDELLLEVDKTFNDKYFSEDTIKEGEKLPSSIKLSLEKGKNIKDWKNNKLNSLINDCLLIENNINDINKINEKIKKYNLIDFHIFFEPTEENINEFLSQIKAFGNIKEKQILFDSLIEFDQELVKSWLNNKNFISELLFRKTRDGSKIDDFHKKCDNKGITIVFIETTKGYKFGGYTELQWNSNSGHIKDKSTFIFSFNNKQKYTPRNDNNTIYCGEGQGPQFGCDYPEIHFVSGLDKGRSYDESTKNTFLLGKKLTNGEQNWEVKELEIFKIIYI